MGISKQCICQLCSCGRHKCPHHPCPAGPFEPSVTEYRNVFQRHPLVVTLPFKPQQFQLSEAPFNSKTTQRLDGREFHAFGPENEKLRSPNFSFNCGSSYRKLLEDLTLSRPGRSATDVIMSDRVDYIRHPYMKPHHHEPDPYCPLDGCLESLTSYRQEFTAKPLCPIKPFPHKPRQLPGSFDGDTTQRVDYTRWPATPLYRHQPDPHKPLADPFDGTTSYRDSYVGHKEKVRPIMAPDQTPYMSEAPFDDRTEHRESFTRKQLPSPTCKEEVAYCPNDTPFDALSIYRKDFHPKSGGKQPSYKPDGGPYLSADPFVGATTQRVDFVRHPSGRPARHQPDPYHAPDGDMSSDTTTRTDFNRKPLDTVKACKPKERQRAVGCFDGLSTYRQNYVRWQADRRQPFHPPEYAPVEDAFDAISSYRTDYVGQTQPVRPIMAPDNTPMMSEVPLDDGTEYRMEFTNKKIPPCVAAVIQSGGESGYAFQGEDPTGHQWYTAKAGV